jgi:hypothetical protein
MKNKNLYLLTPKDLRKIRNLVRILEKAITEIAELNRITTFDDQRRSYQPHESDLIEEQYFLEKQLEFFSRENDF